MLGTGLDSTDTTGTKLSRLGVFVLFLEQRRERQVNRLFPTVLRCDRVAREVGNNIGWSGLFGKGAFELRSNDKRESMVGTSR